MLNKIKITFKDGVAINETWSDTSFINRFKSAYDAMHTKLSELFKSSFGTLSIEDYSKSFDESKIDIQFRIPESEQFSTACGLKILDIPMIDFGSFEERSNGKVDDFSSFISRIKTLYFNKILDVAKQSIDDLPNNEDFRIFVKYGKSESDSYNLFLVCTGLVTEENGDVCHYTENWLRSIEFEDGIEMLSPKDVDIELDFPRADENTYRYPIGNAKIVDVDTTPSNGSIVEALSSIFTDKLSEAMNNGYAILSKRFFGHNTQFQRLNLEKYEASETIQDAIRESSLFFRLVDHSVFTDNNHDVFAEYDCTFAVVWGDEKYIRIVRASMLVPSNLNKFTTSSKLVIRSVDDVYWYYNTLKRRGIVARYTIVMWDFDGSSTEFWRSHGYEFTKAKRFDPIQKRMYSDGFVTLYEYNESPRNTSLPEEPDPLKTPRPEYVMMDIEEVSKKLGSVVHGINRTNGTSYVYEKTNLTPSMAAKETVLGVLYGLDADKRNPSYRMIEKSINMIASESAAIKNIRIVCESGRVVGKGKIKFIGELSDE